ncbi:MAG: GntR family transcriptional regulator [Deltaproteobacteria bacterium]|nr:GntR family transcriptional regulator [Deltaproteobacteria bacterium]
MQSRVSVEEIRDRICQDIVNRVIPPGSRLLESSLCKRWGVSRTPVREALRLLESEGFVTLAKNRGFVVTTITFADMEHLYAILVELDGLAGSLATPNIAKDAKMLEYMERLHGEMEACRDRMDIEGFIERNVKFHACIFNACGNPWLVDALKNLHLHTNRFIVKALYIPQRIVKSVKEHAAVLACLKREDAGGVKKKLALHFSNSLSDLRNELTNKR